MRDEKFEMTFDDEAPAPLVVAACIPFKVWLKGSFWAYELYNEKGASVYTLDEACEVAEREYGEEWSCVANGREARERQCPSN